MIEITRNKVINDENKWNAPNLYSVLLARKRYESDLALVHKVIAEENQKDNMENCLIAETQYMLLSNVIYPKYGYRYNTSMYLQYALGIMRFMEDDIYNVLPKFFDYGTMDNYHHQFVKKDNNKITHLEDDTYDQLYGKFNNFWN